jgi:hypothetical protein
MSMPRGVAHRLRNESAAAVHFLVVSALRGHGNREDIPT